MAFALKAYNGTAFVSARYDIESRKARPLDLSGAIRDRIQHVDEF